MYNQSAPAAQHVAPTMNTVDAMIQAKRWLLSRDKKPYYADGSLREGQLDGPADVSRLATYIEVCAAQRARGDGWEIGFALGQDGNGYWQGVDLDKIDANDLRALFETMPGYVEVSRSETGGHGIGYGREFQTLGSNGSGIEAYCKGRFFVVTTNQVRDVPLCDLSPFVEGALAPLHKRNATKLRNEGDIGATGFAGGAVDSSTVNELRAALTFHSADEREQWVANLHRLRPLGPQGYGLALEYSKRSEKFDQADFDRVWASCKTIGTSYKAIFDDAQKAGWQNPRAAPIQATYGISTQAFSPQRFQLLGSAALRSIVAMEWAVKGVVVLRGNVVVYGPSASGKSFFVFDMLAAIAEGRPYFGLRTTKRHVVYFALEGRSGVRGRVLAWEAVNGRSLPDNFSIILDQFDLKNPADVAELASRLPRGCVIAIDTLARAGDEDENDAKQRALVINGMMQLQLMIDGLVIAVAHTGKEEDKGLRGHKKLFDALDGVIAVSRNGERRMWRAEKVKDGQDGIARRFKLAVVPIGTDEDGEDITSCVIAPEHGTFMGTPTKALSAGLVHALEAFRVAAGKAGKLDSDGNFVGVHLEDWRSEFYRTSTAENADTKRRNFNRARETLVEVAELLVDNDFYSASGPNGIVTNAAIAAQIKGGTPGHDRDGGGTCPAS